MPRAYDDYVEEDEGKLKQAFDRANPDYWQKIQGNQDAIDNLQDVLADAEDLRADIEQTQSEQRRTRIEDAQKSIREEMEASTYNVSPYVREHLLSHDTILHEARKQVSLQEKSELSKVDQFVEGNARKIAEQALSNSPPQKEISSMSEQEKQTHLKAEIHKAIDNSVNARKQVGMTMIRERERMLQEAKENGSSDPKTDVKIVQKAMYDSVDEKLHKDIHAAFSRYGYDADHKQVAFIAEAGEYERMEETQPQEEEARFQANISQQNQDDDQSQ